MNKLLALALAWALIALFPSPGVAGEAKRLRKPGERVAKPVERSERPLLITDENVADLDRVSAPDPSVRPTPRLGQRVSDPQQRVARRQYRQAGERLNQRVLGRIESRVQNRIGPSDLPSTRATEGTLSVRRTATLPSPNGPK
ncbi:MULTISPECIES: hypothetical protein [unclassified Sphingomonas]|jgi:hypothetical protein|uniref:hypothetical protein n=1 Tax=unclassified Sphingomonas TaxID=196159 RepID=UPI00082C1933|nr:MULTISPECIES: hypothetical protein [unclassified Sphingomonas]